MIQYYSILFIRVLFQDTQFNLPGERADNDVHHGARGKPSLGAARDVRRTGGRKGTPVSTLKIFCESIYISSYGADEVFFFLYCFFFTGDPAGM